MTNGTRRPYNITFCQGYNKALMVDEIMAKVIDSMTIPRVYLNLDIANTARKVEVQLLMSDKILEGNHHD